MIGDFGSNYPDSMTRREYNEYFSDRGIDYEDSLCYKKCKKSKRYKDGCLCNGTDYLSPYEMPCEDDECEYLEEE